MKSPDSEGHKILSNDLMVRIDESKFIVYELQTGKGNRCYIKKSLPLSA